MRFYPICKKKLITFAQSLKERILTCTEAMAGLKKTANGSMTAWVSKKEGSIKHLVQIPVGIFTQMCNYYPASD